MEFLNNLERLMNLYNMNRSELARACGLSTSTVNSWWNRGCQNVSLQTLLKLSAYFNVTIEELAHGLPDCVCIYSSNEYSQEELRLIHLYANFLKSLRVKGVENDN